LDRHLRDYLTCRFEARDSEKLFLSSATYHEYRGDSDAVALTEQYDFSEKGTVRFEKYHFQDGPLAARTCKVDVTGNWERYPYFGDYASMVEIRWVCQLSTI